MGLLTLSPGLWGGSRSRVRLGGQLVGGRGLSDGWLAVPGALVRAGARLLVFGPSSVPCGPQEPRDRNPSFPPMPATCSSLTCPSSAPGSPPPPASVEALPHQIQYTDDWLPYPVHLRPAAGSKCRFLLAFWKHEGQAGRLRAPVTSTRHVTLEPRALPARPKPLIFRLYVFSGFQP